MAVVVFLQSTLPETTGGTTGGGTTVYLAPEQLHYLAQQGHGNTAFIAGFLSIALLCLAGVFWRSTGA